MDDRDGEAISEGKAARVLDRAVRLDALRRGTVSVAELREAALEAGISPEAFERALAEVRAGDVGGAMVEGSERPGWMKALYRNRTLARGGLFLAAALLGFVGNALGEGGLETVFIGGLVGVLALAVRRRPDRQVLEFELDLGVLWFGLTLALMAGSRFDDADVISVTTLLALLGASLGGLLASGFPRRARLPRLAEEA
jgi:hypothetical protein